MRDTLAERLLAKVMDWKPEDIRAHRLRLEALASFKYDEYQKFSPGMRFIESLALWLRQFQPEERIAAYNLVIHKLIFISSSEMAHFVASAYPDFIRPILIREAARILNISSSSVKKVLTNPEFSVLLRRSLFLGLSDGSHIDLFRRSNPALSNEQVWQTYEISETKAEDLSNNLNKDVGQIRDAHSEKGVKFQVVCLLDDFSASGISYLRKDDSGEFKGKISGFLEKLQREDSLGRIIDRKDLLICVVLFVATTLAIERIRANLDDWIKSKGLKFRYDVIAIQQVGERSRLTETYDNEVIQIASKYFDAAIVDEHYRKGRCQKPYLGFDECSLPVVIYHNAPNNSLPILWFDEGLKYRGLFPRVRRHKESI